VRRHTPVDAGGGDRLREDPGHALPGEPPAAPVQEERGPGAGGRELGSGARQIRRDRVAGVPPERHVTLLAALAEHSDAALLQVHVVDVQPRELGDP
jgi:hypothetical protein